MPASPSAHAPQTPANDPLGQWFAAIDAAAHASLAKATGGLAPASFVQSYSDWLVHLCASPGTCADLAAMAAQPHVFFVLGTDWRKIAIEIFNELFFKDFVVAGVL